MLIKGQPLIFKVSCEGYETRAEIVDFINEDNYVFYLKSEEEVCVNYPALILSENNHVLVGAELTFSSDCIQQKIVSNSDQHGYAEICLPKNCNYYLNINLDGFEEHVDSIRIGDMNQTRPDRFVLKSLIHEEEKIIDDVDLKTGAIIVLNNIYYEFDQHIIQEGAARELDQLAEIMKRYPEMKIQLAAHTDARGEAEYNLQLSEKRAASAKEYLVDLLIESDRIVPIGYGEQQIRNQCKDDVPCSKKDHRFNRRTEVKVLHINKDVEIKYNGGK